MVVEGRESLSQGLKREKVKPDINLFPARCPTTPQLSVYLNLELRKLPPLAAKNSLLLEAKSPLGEGEKCKNVRDALEVGISLLVSSTDGREKALDDLVNEKLKLLIVKAVLSQVRDGVADFAVKVQLVSNHRLKGLAEHVVVGDDFVHVLADLELFSEDLVDGLLSAGEKLLIASLQRRHYRKYRG
jgi:hypothetical protein